MFDNPLWLIVGVVAVVLIALVVLGGLPKRSAPEEVSSAGPLPYLKKASLLTPPELKFYSLLRSATPPKVHIAPKVRMLDLLDIPSGTEKYQSYRNKVIQKHVDFVLCQIDTMAPLLIIELDDRTHERPDRLERDDSVDAIMQAAGLPILHVPTRQSYNSQELATLIQTELGGQLAQGQIRRNGQ